MEPGEVKTQTGPTWPAWEVEAAKASVRFLRLGKVIVTFVYLVVLAGLALLTLAFFLRLFGANPEADFAAWVYRSVDGLMEPFRGIFPTEELTARSVLDFSLLFAMIVYSMIAISLHALIGWLTSVRLAATQAVARHDWERSLPASGAIQTTHEQSAQSPRERPPPDGRSEAGPGDSEAIGPSRPTRR